MMRVLSRRILLGFTLFYIADIFFSFFANTESVLMQTIMAAALMGLHIYILLLILFYDRQHMLIRNVLIAYIVGGFIMYLYALAFCYDCDVVVWALSLNNYFVLVPIYTFSIIGAIIHTAWKR